MSTFRELLICLGLPWKHITCMKNGENWKIIWSCFAVNMEMWHDFPKTDAKPKIVYVYTV